LCGRQLILADRREILHPAVVDDRNRKKALPSHAGVAGNRRISLRGVRGEESNAADDGDVSRIAVAVRIRIDDEQPVRELDDKSMSAASAASAYK
jgi:hypothetical protein